MALIFKKAAAPKKKKSTGGSFDFKSWYQKNKERLAEKKRKRYQEDPEYRAKAMERSKAQRKTTPTPITDGYSVSFAEAAKELGVSLWTLREWRKRNYFPEPKERNGRLWFTENQLMLLQKLQEFFVLNGRIKEGTKEKMNELVSLLFANWKS